MFCLPAALIFGDDSDVTSQCLVATEGVEDGTFSIPDECQPDLTSLAQTSDVDEAGHPKQAPCLLHVILGNVK